MCVMVPPNHPLAKDTPPYSSFKRLSPAQKWAELERTLAEYQPLLQQRETSGFHSATSSVLSFAYAKCGGDTETFAFRCYPLICAHIFAPAHRLFEQEAYSPLHGPGKLDLLSSLTQIEYNIRASSLYGSANHLGRTKYLKYYFIPVLTEVFKGLEYLARLYFISVDNANARRRFKDFLASFSPLPEKHINALWQLRCGLVHSGTLYNPDRNKIWRFGVITKGDYGAVLVQDRLSSPLRGEHYTLNTDALIRLFFEAKSFVENDMLTNPEKYLSKREFFEWIQRYFTIQYLPSHEEMKTLWGMPNIPDPLFDQFLDSGPRYGIAEVRVSRFYLFKLAFPRMKEDVLSRVRDLFTPL